MACLALLLIASLLATAGIREATLELAKTGSQQAALRAFTAAQAGLAVTLAGGGFGHTAPRDLPETPLPGGGSWAAEVRFLGVAPLPATMAPADASEVAWHFGVTATGRAARGAISRQRRQVYVRGEAPADLARCRDPGCAVPRRCPAPPPGCAGLPPAVPIPLGWHEVEALP